MEIEMVKKFKERLHSDISRLIMDFQIATGLFDVRINGRPNIVVLSASVLEYETIPGGYELEIDVKL